MPFYNYGAKNGVATVVAALKLLCRIYSKFYTPINTFIGDHPGLTDPQKTQIKDWLALASTICSLFESYVNVNYETEPG